VQHDNDSGVIDTILEVGRQRAAWLALLRAALEAGNDEKALQIARRLTNLPENRTR